MAVYNDGLFGRSLHKKEEMLEEGPLLLPSILRKNSINMRKLRSCAMDRCESRKNDNRSVDLGDMRANLGQMIRKVKTDNVGIQNLPSLGKDMIRITTQDSQYSITQSKNILHAKDQTLIFHRKSSQSKKKYDKKQIRYNPDLSDGDNKVPIFSIKLLKAIVKNIHTLKTPAPKSKTEGIQHPFSSKMFNQKQKQIYELEMQITDNSLGQASQGKKQMKNKELRRDFSQFNHGVVGCAGEHILQSIVLEGNGDDVEGHLLEASNQRQTQSSSHLFRSEYTISPWN